MRETIDKLKAHASETQSKWCDEAQKRIEDKVWLRHSQMVASIMLAKMDELGINQRMLAEKMNCTQQYISKVLKGKENLSLETLTKIEQALGVKIIKDSAQI